MQVVLLVLLLSSCSALQGVKKISNPIRHMKNKCKHTNSKLDYSLHQVNKLCDKYYMRYK